MSDCEYCQEDHCILSAIYPEAKKCNKENKDGICTATDDDLVTMCSLCEVNKAEEDSEYCKKCNKELNE